MRFVLEDIACSAAQCPLTKEYTLNDTTVPNIKPYFLHLGVLGLLGTFSPKLGEDHVG